MTRRHAAQLFVLLMIAAQLALPLRYYLRQDQREDERFAWRMFSSVRLASCSSEVTQEDASGQQEPVRLQGELHVAWINLLKRGRPRVIERFLQTRCARAGVARAHHRAVCDEDGQRRVERLVTLTCDSGRLERREGPL